MLKRTVVPPVWLCWFTCLGGLAAYFWGHGDHVTAGVVSLIAVTGLAGYWLGGAVILAFLAALTTSGFFATRLAQAFEPTVADLLGTSGILNRIMSCCIGCVLIGFVAMLIFEIVWNRLLGKRGRLRQFNKSLGLSLGAIQGAALALILLGAILVAEPYARFARATRVLTIRDFVGQCTADSVVKVSQASRRSPIGPFVKQFNPFERVPQLRQLRQTRGQHVAIRNGREAMAVGYAR